MTACDIPGRPDLYGLGIRTAFYIQWSAAVLTAFIDESELPDIRHLGLLLSAATTLSIIISASSSSSSSSVSSSVDDIPLQPADVYITLLLATGIYTPLIPPALLRLLTLGSPYWNPFRFLRERPSPASRACSFLLLLAVSSVAVWAFTTFIPAWWVRPPPGAGGFGAIRCEQYGFFFSPVSLDDRAFVVFNALLYIVIILVCAGLLLSKSGCEVRTWSKERKRRKVRTRHRATIHTLHMISNTLVVVVLIVAVELTISFNGLRDSGDGGSSVDDLSSASQTIPVFISAGIFVRVVYRWVLKRGLDNLPSDDDDDDDEEAGYYYPEEQDPAGGPVPPPPVHTA